MEEEVEVEVQGRAGPGGRLNMSHGFVHHIRRNQVARDDYDREVKQAKEKQKKRYTPGPTRQKKPDLQVYHPRQRAPEKAHTTEALKDEPNDNGTQLFCLDFEADGGEVTSIIVYEDDDAEQLATMISNQNQLEGGMREALKQRIQEEISKRRVQR